MTLLIYIKVLATSLVISLHDFTISAEVAHSDPPHRPVRSHPRTLLPHVGFVISERGDRHVTTACFWSIDSPRSKDSYTIVSLIRVLGHCRTMPLR